MALPLNTDDLESGIARTLDRKFAKLSRGPYCFKKTDDVAKSLAGCLPEWAPNARISGTRRLPGGGSKEQFVFSLTWPEHPPGKYVLRIDPPQSPVETDRQREFEVLRALQGLVPVPTVHWVDPTGAAIGGPAVIMSFVDGVTKPSASSSGNVSGLGVRADGSLRAALAEQFLESLVKLHRMDWQSKDLPSFQAPSADVFQAARWQANWWSRVWRDDMIHPLPTIAIVERWMHDNFPACDLPCMVHGDYRNGNFLFDEAKGQITAILDWELAHIGDFHEDLAWILLSPFGHFEAGQFYVCGLLTREQLFAGYQAKTGRTINPSSLRFYEILARYKLMTMTFATEIKAVKYQQTHQDALVSWIAAVGHLFHSEICQMMQAEYACTDD